MAVQSGGLRLLTHSGVDGLVISPDTTTVTATSCVDEEGMGLLMSLLYEPDILPAHILANVDELLHNEASVTGGDDATTVGRGFGLSAQNQPIVNVSRLLKP